MKNPRQKIMAELREVLTREIWSNTPFVEALEKMLLNPDKVDQKTVVSLAQFFGLKLSRREYELGLKCSALGRMAAKKIRSIYCEFMVWVLKEATLLKADTVWFSGRDSRILMQIAIQSKSWSHSGIKLSWQPFCRGNIYHCYQKRFSPLTVEKESEDVVTYYEKNNLIHNKALVVDFGFFGTLERAHRLMLMARGLSESYLLGHRLFLKSPKNENDKTIFDKGVAEAIVGISQVDALKKSDEEYHSKVIGFLNTMMEKQPKFMGENGKTYLDMDTSFIFWLQESGSGIADACFDLKRAGHAESLDDFSCRLGNFAQFAYWQGFQKQINSKWENESMTIDALYDWYRTNKVVLAEMIAVEDRDACGIAPNYKKLIVESNQKLVDAGLQMTTVIESYD